MQKNEVNVTWLRFADSYITGSLFSEARPTSDFCSRQAEGGVQAGLRTTFAKGSQWSPPGRRSVAPRRSSEHPAFNRRCRQGAPLSRWNDRGEERGLRIGGTLTPINTRVLLAGVPWALSLSPIYLVARGFLHPRFRERMRKRALLECWSMVDCSIHPRAFGRILESFTVFFTKKVKTPALLSPSSLLQTMGEQSPVLTLLPPPPFHLSLPPPRGSRGGGWWWRRALTRPPSCPHPPFTLGFGANLREGATGPTHSDGATRSEHHRQRGGPGGVCVKSKTAVCSLSG